MAIGRSLGTKSTSSGRWPTAHPFRYRISSVTSPRHGTTVSLARKLTAIPGFDPNLGTVVPGGTGPANSENVKLPPAASQGRLEARNNCRSNFTEISLRPLSVTALMQQSYRHHHLTDLRFGSRQMAVSLVLGSDSYNQNRIAQPLKRNVFRSLCRRKHRIIGFESQPPPMALGPDSPRQRSRQAPPPRNQRRSPARPAKRSTVPFRPPGPDGEDA